MSLQIPASILASLAALFVLSGCEKSADTEPAASPSGSTMPITGAGSSFATQMFNKWFDVYAQDHADLALSDDSVGSGEGIDRFLAGAVDIGATDAPLRPDEAAKVKGPYLQIPVTGGMIAIAYNLPGINGPLNLPCDVDVDIFCGTRDRWDALPLAQGARLLFTPCPGTKGVGLAESLSQLRGAGADAVISMTPSDELARLEVAALPEAVAGAGMGWLHLPVEDDAAPGPAFEQAWAANRDALMALVSRGGGLAIHCRGGSGRTGFMAALILRAMGMDGARADALVKGLRPNALTLPAHADYLAARDGRYPEQEQPL